MGNTYSTATEIEEAVLVTVIRKSQPVEQAHEHLEELAFLAKTAGVKVLETFVQKLDHPHVKTFLGKGKLEEVISFVKAKDIDMVIFDDDLSPSQVRNLEKALECKILDRSLLILDIFSLRAKTAQAKTQVELAQYQYLLPRLTNMWTHLSKQKGGIGMKGPGETELETDRRIIRDKISLLKKQLVKIDKQSTTQRKSRSRMVRTAFVGYTNVGKSTIMRLLSKSEVFAENKLFATVDSTVRKVVINQIPFLLTDTVGFIRKLPHTLVECFKSTLDEIREADVLIHVVDISHPSFDEQIEVVNATLVEIGAVDKPTILVFNKIDQYFVEGNEEEDKEKEVTPTLEDLKTSYLGKNNQEVVFVSAIKKENFEELRKTIFKLVSKRHYTIFPNYLKNNTYYG